MGSWRCVSRILSPFRDRTRARWCRQNHPNAIAPTVGTMKKVTAWIMRGSLLQMACRSSTTTFRRDTATERLRAREELLSKGYAFLEDPISRATRIPGLRPRRSRRARHGREVRHRATATGRPRGSALAPGGDGGYVLRRAGAVSRVAEAGTAFGNRQASHAITLDGVWR